MRGTSQVGTLRLHLLLLLGILCGYVEASAQDSPYERHLMCKGLQYQQGRDAKPQPWEEVHHKALPVFAHVQDAANAPV